MKVEIPSFNYLPQRVSRLGELAYNLWWSWSADARSLFRNLDRTLWAVTRQNPVRILREISPERLAQVCQDEGFVALYDSVVSRFDEYMSASDTWFNQTYPQRSEDLVAYFCAEFAVHTTVPIYSGGLGLLAGDTCKEASDLGVPFIAVGALYPEGYFRQVIGADGNQDSVYERIQTELTPLLPVLNDDGSKLVVPIPLDGRSVKVAVWQLQVGRIPIFLMDTNIPENEPWDRDVVARLYGGDSQVRLRQEIVLGIGGVRILRALGYDPTVIHLNEGHAAFAALELIRELREQGLSLEESINATRKRLVFTTHTPVKAGHDDFPFHMMEEHFVHFWGNAGVSREDFLNLGKSPQGHSFSMTVLALNTAHRINGVSKRHGEVSREMWHFLYPDRSVHDVPIISITNGVHFPTWFSAEMVDLARRFGGQDWRNLHDEPGFWEWLKQVPNDEMWRAHCTSKSRLVSFMQDRARDHWMKFGASPGQIVALGTLLNPEALTIGFARRFATYKRAGLILRDMDRLKRIVLNPWRPVQMVFAGKAHPADEPGKFVLKKVFEVCSSQEFGGRIAFIENYNKQVAHRLVNGVDIWMNNPEVPKEASGTSGQKTSLNGVPNFSVLDGWWCEGFNGENGWSIEGESEEQVAENIYNTLENRIVPLYYDRDANGVPNGWVKLMKEAIRSTAAPFSTRRMLKEYIEKIYW